MTPEFDLHSPGFARCPACRPAGALYPMACPCGGLVHVERGAPAVVARTANGGTIVERALSFWCDGCGDERGP